MVCRPGWLYEPGGGFRRRVVLGLVVGVWGLLLGVPTIMIIKVVCGRVEDLKPVGELPGD
jgi:hypothetical protein